MARTLCASAVAAALTVAAGVASADEIDRPFPGARVRVTEAGVGVRRVGTLLALDDRYLALAVADRSAPLIVAREDVVKLDLSAGHGSRGKNAVWGAMIGAGVGAVVGMIGGAASSPADQKTLGALESGLVLVVMAAPVGALIGAMIEPGERWKEVPWGRVRIGARRRGEHGVAISATLAF